MESIHFDSVEGQAWMNRVSPERLDELEVELFDTVVLRREEPVISTLERPKLETHLR